MRVSGIKTQNFSGTLCLLTFVVKKYQLHKKQNALKSLCLKFLPQRTRRGHKEPQNFSKYFGGAWLFSTLRLLFFAVKKIVSVSVTSVPTRNWAGNDVSASGQARPGPGKAPVQ